MSTKKRKPVDRCKVLFEGVARLCEAYKFEGILAMVGMFAEHEAKDEGNCPHCRHHAAELSFGLKALLDKLEKLDHEHPGLEVRK